MDGAVPGCPRLYFGVVDVRDIADLHIRAMTSPAAKGERFLGVAGDFMSIREIAEVLKTRLGAAARRVPTRQAAELAGAPVCAASIRRRNKSCRSSASEEWHRRKGEAAARLGAALATRMPSWPPAKAWCGSGC